jgi:hypothetical protein
VNIASRNRIKLAQSTRISARRKPKFTVMVTAR